jgi:hypothetical protein
VPERQQERGIETAKASRCSKQKKKIYICRHRTTLTRVLIALVDMGKFDSVCDDARHALGELEARDVSQERMKDKGAKINPDSAVKE